MKRKSRKKLKTYDDWKNAKVKVSENQKDYADQRHWEKNNKFEQNWKSTENEKNQKNVKNWKE